MLRKFFAYIGLVAVINSSCVVPAIAGFNEYQEDQDVPVGMPIFVEQSAADKRVIDYKEIQEWIDLYPGVSEYVLIHDKAVFAMVRKSGDNFYIKGLRKHNLLLRGFKSFEQLIIHGGGSIEFEDSVLCRHYLDVQTPATILFKAGFKVSEKGGLVKLDGLTVDLDAECHAEAWVLNKPGQVYINDNCRVSATYMRSEGLIQKLMIYGQLMTQIHELAGIKLLDNMGTAKFGKGALKVDALENSGTLNIDMLRVKQSWTNNENGKIMIAQLLEAMKLKNFDDQGETKVLGLAMVSGLDGFIGGEFWAGKANIHLHSGFTLAKKAKLYLQHHLNLISDADINLFGNIHFLQTHNDWPLLNLDDNLLEAYDNLPDGAFLTAAHDILKEGSVRLTYGDIIYCAGGRYIGQDGINQPGLFDNRILIYAQAAKLADQMRTTAGVDVIAKAKVDLLGQRQIAGEFRVFTEDLHQHPNDQSRAAQTTFNARSTTLAGDNTVGQAFNVHAAQLKEEATLRVAGTGESVSSVQAEKMTVAGQWLGLRVQGAASEFLLLDPSYNGDVESSDLEGKKALSHMSGSLHKVKTQNKEASDGNISFGPNSKTHAQDNILKSGWSIFVDGAQIKSDRQYKADVRHSHYLMNGGAISAQHSSVKADWMSYTGWGSRWSTKTLEVNTFLNWDPFMLAQGRQSTTVNAFANIFPGAVLPSNYVDNSWVSLSLSPQKMLMAAGYATYTGISLKAVALMAMMRPAIWTANKYSEDNFITSLKTGLYESIESTIDTCTSPSYLITKGFQWGVNWTVGKYKLAMRTAQLAWNTGTAGYRAAEAFKAYADEGDDAWRWSRFVKLSGAAIGIGKQAFHTGKEAVSLYHDQIAFWFPEPPQPTIITFEGDIKTDGEVRIDENGITVTDRPAESAYDTTEKDGDSHTAAHEEDTTPPTWMEILWPQARDSLFTTLGGTIESNNLVHFNFGSTAAGNIQRHALFYFGYGADYFYSRSLNCYTGSDYTWTEGFKDTIYARSDFSVGGRKQLLEDQYVHAGGDLTLTEDLRAAALNNYYTADGRLFGIHGAVANAVEQSLFQCRLDLLLELQAKSKNIFIQSKEGSRRVTDRADLEIVTDTDQAAVKNVKPNLIAIGKTDGEFNAKVRGDARAYVEGEGREIIKPDFEGTSLTGVAKTGELGGNITVTQGEKGIALKGEWELDDNATIRVGDNPDPLTSDELADYKEQLGQAISENAQELKDAETKPQSPQDVPEKAEDKKEKKHRNPAKKLLKKVIKNGSTARSKVKRKKKVGQESSETPEEQTPEPIETAEPEEAAPESAPEKPEPKFSIVVDGYLRMNGNIALEHGVGVTDRPKNADKTPTEDKAKHGIEFASGLKLIGGDAIMADTIGKIIKEPGSYIVMPEVYLKGDKGVEINGLSLAENSFVATSLADVVEGATAQTLAGESVVFYAEGNMIKHQDAKANSVKVIRHGESGGECAGDVDAEYFTSFTIGEHVYAVLKIKGNTVFDAPHQRVGSFAEEPEQTKEETKAETNPQETQPESPPVVTPVEPQSEKSKNKSKSNPRSRSQYPHDQEQSKPKKPKNLGKDNDKKEEAEEPEPVAPPIDEAGRVEMEEGVQFRGKTLTMRGKGIEHLVDLLTQTGFYEGMDITDFLSVHSDQSVKFKEDARAASKWFELIAHQIKFKRGVTLDGDVLKFCSTDLDMILAHGVHLRAKIYLELLSEKNIVGEFKKRLMRHRDGTEQPIFKNVILEGGSGFEYEYVDQDTGVKSIRRVGLRVDANDKVRGLAMHLVAPGDVHIRGFNGIENESAHMLYVAKIKEESNWFRDKVKTYYDTAFAVPAAISTNGKVLFMSENGGLRWRAGAFHGNEGADLIFNGHVWLLHDKGYKGHVTDRDAIITFGNGYDYTKHGLAPSVMMINQGDSPWRIWTSKHHDIIAPGLVFDGKKGTLHTRGRWGFFTRTKLQHESHSTSTHVSVDYSILANMMSLSGLKACKNVFHQFAEGNFLNGGMGMLNPSVTVGAHVESTDRKWESLGDGRVQTKDWIVDFSKGLITNNAYEVEVTGDFIVRNLPYWYQGGANLHSAYSSTRFGVNVGYGAGGPTAGGSFGYSKGKSNNWVMNNIKIYRFIGEVGLVEQDAARMNIDVMDGSIDNIVSRSHKDRSKSYGFNMGLQWSYGTGVSGSAGGSYHTSAQANHVSGLTIGECTDRARVGHANLVGAEVNGIKPESQTSVPLSRDYNVGGQVAIGLDKKGLSNVTVGVSKDGKSLLLSLDIHAMSQTMDAENPWHQIGSVTVNGIALPIMTQINGDFFKAWGDDINKLNDKIFGSVEHEISQHLAALPVPQQPWEEWTPIEDGDGMGEVPVVDLPYEDTQPQSAEEDVHSLLDDRRARAYDIPEWLATKAVVDGFYDGLPHGIAFFVKMPFNKLLNGIASTPWGRRMFSWTTSLIPTASDEEWNAVYSEFLDAEARGDEATASHLSTRLESMSNWGSIKLFLRSPQIVALYIGKKVRDLCLPEREKVIQYFQEDGNLIRSYLEDLAEQTKGNRCVESLEEFQNERDAYIDSMCPPIEREPFIHWKRTDEFRPNFDDAADPNDKGKEDVE